MTLPLIDDENVMRSRRLSFALVLARLTAVKQSEHVVLYIWNYLNPESQSAVPPRCQVLSSVVC